MTEKVIEDSKASAGLSIRVLAEAFFKTTDALTQFARTDVKPQIHAALSLNPSEREIAIAGTYLRMFGWMQSLVALNGPAHFQAAAAAARTSFELKLDLLFLHHDSDGSRVKQYHAFPLVEKYRSARQLIAFTQSENLGDEDLSAQKRFLEKIDRQQIDALLSDNWRLRRKDLEHGRPVHWTGLSAKQRATQMDRFLGGKENEGVYLETYPLLSWFIHSGSTGTSGMSEHAIESLFGWCHRITQECFKEATTICAKELKIDKAIEGFEKKLEEAALTGERFIDQHSEQR